MSAESIKAKALTCIDEAYPYAESIHDGYFPIDSFIDEAVRWVIDSAPTHLLTMREVCEIANFENNGGVVELEVIAEGRIVYVKCKDWQRPVFDLISEQNPLYLQQRNKVLRGNPARPVVARLGSLPNSGEYSLELYTSDISNVNEIDIQMVPYADEYIPVNLEDITAWKLAEIVLMASSDVEAASVCTAKVNEHLQQLSL